MDRAADTLAGDDVGHDRRQDALLRRIDDEQLIPAWAWPTVLDTVAVLRGLPAGHAAIVTAYLAAVAARGHEMYSDRTAVQMRLEAEGTAPQVDCPCGRRICTDRPTTHWRTETALARCGDCGRCTAMIGGEAYERPTLITAHVR